MKHELKPYDLTALAKELRASADLQRKQAPKQRALEDRPTAPPGELTTDTAGFTWEKPRDKLDTWDPTPDATEAAIVAKVAALRALPDDLDPDGPHAPIDYSMPARVPSPRHDGWHPERRLAFLEQLAGTASVTEAARYVEMSRQSARRLYNRDPAFRRAWHAALRKAKIVLFESAFDRATRGTQIPFWDRQGQLIGYRERHHDHLLISLLRMCGRGELSIEEDDEWVDEEAAEDNVEELQLLARSVPTK